VRKEARAACELGSLTRRAWHHPITEKGRDTVKKSSRKPKAADTLTLPATDCTAGLSVTREEAATLAECITWTFMDDGDEIARFLLLCHAFTYTRDMNDRENMMTAIEQKLAPLTNGYDGMLHAEMSARLASIRAKGKGGAK